MRSYCLGALFVAAIMLGGCGESSSPQTNSTMKHGSSIANFVPKNALVKVSTDAPFNTSCPIGNEPVDAKGTKLSFDGKVYAFCCDDCLESFDKEPAKFAALIKEKMTTAPQ